MYWKLRAFLQATISKLPSNIKYDTYYYLQCLLGAFANNAKCNFHSGISFLNYIKEQKRSVISKVFLELGTGRRLSTPIVLWLSGASKIITVDRVLLLKQNLVWRDLLYIKSNIKDIVCLFGEHGQTDIFKKRIELLLNFDITKNNIHDFIQLADITYLVSDNSTVLDIKSKSVDYCISYAVLEHIHADILEELLAECSRTLCDNGFFLHDIDLSDHFSAWDASILPINFLKFNDIEYSGYLENELAYTNRLRIDDFLKLFERIGIRVSVLKNEIDPKSLAALENGFELDDKFKNKSKATNATIKAVIWGAPDRKP